MMCSTPTDPLFNHPHKPSSKYSILVVDGNPHHTQLITDAFAKETTHQVFSVIDAGTALAFIQQQPPYDRAPQPDLILLDLQLPDGSGQAFLQAIKEDPRLKRIPVVILTGSHEPDTIFESYARQGNCYVIKSQDPEQLSQTVQQIQSFWLGIVTLPVLDLL